VSFFSVDVSFAPPKRPNGEGAAGASFLSAGASLVPPKILNAVGAAGVDVDGFSGAFVEALVPPRLKSPPDETAGAESFEASLFPPRLKIDLGAVLAPVVEAAWSSGFFPKMPPPKSPPPASGLVPVEGVDVLSAGFGALLPKRLPPRAGADPEVGAVEVLEGLEKKLGIAALGA
jgi:hypothetical protein